MSTYTNTREKTNHSLNLKDLKDNIFNTNEMHMINQNIHINLHSGFMQMFAFDRNNSEKFLFEISEKIISINNIF